MATAHWLIELGLIPALLAPMAPVHAQSLQQVQQSIDTKLQEMSAIVAADVKERREYQASQLASNINSARAAQCHAKGDDTKRLYQEDIDRMQSEYHKLEGHDKAVPACSSL